MIHCRLTLLNEHSPIMPIWGINGCCHCLKHGGPCSDLWPHCIPCCFFAVIFALSNYYEATAGPGYEPLSVR
jgi:hypothetical protein